MQLVAYGAQDVYLTGNPQITFFKVVYRRYTNFSMEVFERAVIGNPTFNGQFTVIFTRNADLINKMYIKIKLNSVDPNGNNFAWVRRLGHAFVTQLEFVIGGTIFDRQYGTWLDIWYELARRGDHERGYAHMIGDVPELTEFNTNIKPEYTLYIPLQFWFNRHIGLSIPLIALQYHDARLNVQLNSKEHLIIKDSNFDDSLVQISDVSVLVNYIYLDTDERRRFAQVGHEYLIEQLQFNGIEQVTDPNKIYRLDYNHPTKEIIWGMKNGNFNSGKRFLFYTHRDDWSKNYTPLNSDNYMLPNITPLDAAVRKIIFESISTTINPNNGGDWFPVDQNSYGTIGTINITNNSNNIVYINPESLNIGNYGITNKINADVNITSDGIILIESISTSLTVRDFSIPHSFMTDTRFNPIDPFIYQHHNFGILLDGSINPIDYAQLKLNGHDRFNRLEGSYFNYVQPDQHHSNSPADGINVYSFSLYPEEHQPSGTANLSRIEEVVIQLWFKDASLTAFDSELPDLNFFNSNNTLWIFGTNYNIMRVMSGLAGLAYTLT